MEQSLGIQIKLLSENKHIHVSREGFGHQLAVETG
jgi:hypothetical protein